MKAKWKIRAVFNPRDLWVGVYWNYDRDGQSKRFIMRVCLVPFFPVVISRLDKAPSEKCTPLTKLSAEALKKDQVFVYDRAGWQDPLPPVGESYLETKPWS